MKYLDINSIPEIYDFEIEYIPVSIINAYNEAKENEKEVTRYED